MDRSQANAVKPQTQILPARPAQPLHLQSPAKTPESALLQGMGNQVVQRTLHGTIQAKFNVNSPGDPFEQEADRVAEAVVSMPETDRLNEIPGAAVASVPRIQRKCAACEAEEKKSAPPIQRKCAACAQQEAGGEATPEVAARIQSLRGGGQALPESVRNFFEPRFGADFSGVRTHTDAESTRSLGAKAYTVGRDIVFGNGQYSPQTETGRKLLAHELTHVVQQGAATSRASHGGSESIQRAGDPAAIPPGFPCPTDLAPGTPAGTDIVFTISDSTISPAHTVQLTAFVAAWLAGGGTDDVLVHGYASTDGAQASNWTLSCDRAQAVQAELIRLGIPPVRVSIVAHGESTDFGASLAANRHAVVSSSAAGLIQLPVVTGTLTARDNFARRSAVRFGVGEIIDLNFFSFPATPAADFGGLQWVVVSGGGVLVTPLPPDGTGTYTAPAAAGAVTLELRVAAGATAGRVISNHPITIVEPEGVRMVAVPGSFPGTSASPGATPIPAGTAGAGMLANVFVDPRDVSFRGVVFGEGTVTSIVTGAWYGPPVVHGVNTFGPGRGGNRTTGTPVSPPSDQIANHGPRTGNALGIPFCGGAGGSTFLWAIPWEFSVAGGPRTRMVRRANHFATMSFGCNATIQKGGAGPFCRRINGTVC